MPLPNEKHVFVSHSHKDSAAAESVVTALERRGVPCWIAPRDVSPGGSYAESILTAIETASCFVLIYSEHSNVSSHVLREVERALKFGVNIVPVRFDDSTPSKSLDYLLATVHWLAIPAESREGSVAKAAEQIAEWLTNFLTNPATPLPVRPSPFQPSLVTPLGPPPRKSRKMLVEAVIVLAFIGAGVFATGHLNSFKTFWQKPMGSKGAITPSSAPTSHAPMAKISQPTGYAGVSPRPRATAAPNTNNNLTNRPQAPNGMSAPPPPPPGAPGLQYGNGPGSGAPPDGRFPPPPPPPPGHPMFGPGNGPGPGRPPHPDGPRP